RTDLLREGVATAQLIESGIDVLSVDVIADSPSVYEQLACIDGYERVFDRLQSVYDAIGEHPLWLAARMTRCEQTLDQVESFYDKWLMLSGSGSRRCVCRAGGLNRWSAESCACAATAWSWTATAEPC
ncbi:MAG: hypothetical protein NXI07_11405, partial [bacterium]|nr:hypothetical protein [bacterium]